MMMKMEKSLLLLVLNLALLALCAKAASKQSKSTDELINDLMQRMQKDMSDLDELKDAVKDHKEEVAVKDHKGHSNNETAEEHESLFNINAREKQEWIIHQNMKLEEGDMLLTPEQVAIEKKDNDPRISRDALINPASRWPKTGGRVKIPIVMDGMDAQKLAAIREAAQKFTEGTCIDFEMTTQTNEHYIRFINGGGCYSYLGKVTNGPENGYQPISIGNGCGFLGIVEHEMMHALGFYHEQARPDRDEFVRLQLQNLANPQFASQFAKQRAARVDTVGENYDFNSIMHYDSGAFAQRGLLTIVRLNGARINGNRDGFSASDLRGLNKIYQCAGTEPETPEPTDGPDGPGPEPTVNCKAFATIGLCGYSEICDLCSNECAAAAAAASLIRDRNTRCPGYVQSGFCTSANARTKSYMQRNCQKACIENQFPPDGCN